MSDTDENSQRGAAAVVRFPESCDPMQTVRSMSPSMFAYWDATLTCRLANEAFHRWLDIKPESLPGRSLQGLLGPELLAANWPFIQNALAGIPQEFGQMFPGPNGSMRPTLAKYVPHFVDGQVMGFVAYVTDVSRLLDVQTELTQQIADAQRANRLLEKKEFQLRQAQRLGGIGNWDWDVDADAIRWSDELYRIFGRALDTLPPGFADHRQLYTAGSWAMLTSAIERILVGGGTFALELQYVAQDGRTGWVEARGEVERDEQGCLHVFGTVLETTQSRRQRTDGTIEKMAAEQKQQVAQMQREILHLKHVLGRASKMVMIGRLAIGAIHSFKNAIFVAANALRQFALLSVEPQLKEWLHIAQMAIAQASGMARSVLRLSETRASQPSVTVELNAALQDFAPVFKAAVDADVTVVVQRSRPVWVRIDVKQFEMAILNLVINAGDALIDGGKIVLSVQDDVPLPTWKDGPRMVSISVRDNGEGMTPYVLKRAREPYFTSKEQGTGLGLASVNSFVKTLGGYLSLVSSPGRGTVATLVIPAHATH